MRPLAAATAALVALMLLAAPLALAGADERPAKARERAEKSLDARADRSDRDEDNGTDAKDARATQRRAFLDAFRESLRQWRDAWKENATDVREACHATSIDHANASKEERKAWSHCIRDGYRAFFEAFRLERAAFRAEWKATRDA